jgi:hypothetical protein
MREDFELVPLEFAAVLSKAMISGDSMAVDFSTNVLPFLSYG